MHFIYNCVEQQQESHCYANAEMEAGYEETDHTEQI
jgi:hypothetical protein